MSLTEGLYLIQPKEAHTGKLLIGPVPIDAPDTPVLISNHPLTERWLVKKASDGKYFIYAKRDRPEDYKWIAKADGLYVSSKSESPTPFRVQPGEGNTFLLIHGDDKTLTVRSGENDSPDKPQLIFKGQDGSIKQRFVFTPASHKHSA